MSDIEKVEIGKATLYRGDCLAVTHLLTEVHHTITDPPYEASMHTKDRLVSSSAGWGTETMAHSFAAMDEATRQEITKLIVQKTSGWALIFCQSEGAHYWIKQLKHFGAKYRFTGVWVKPSSKPNLSGDAPGLGYESIVGAWCTMEGKSQWNGGGKAAVWTANPEKRTEDNSHTTIKPQRLMAQLVADFTNKDQVIFDPFMGSGSTGVAAVSVGRRFIGIERDPAYFEICCRRLEEAQKGMFDTPYTKTKGTVAMPLFEAPPKKAAQVTLTAPKKKPLTGRKRAEMAAAAQPTAPKSRFAAPMVELAAGVSVTAREVAVTRTNVSADTAPAENVVLDLPVPIIQKPLISPLAEYEPLLAKYGDKRIPFDDDFSGGKSYVGLDIEVFSNFFLVCFLRFSDNKKKSFELSERSELDLAAIDHILKNNCIVTFNGKHYDMPLLTLALQGERTNTLKHFSDKIIYGNLRGWDSASGRSAVEKELGVKVPEEINQIDLKEPCPAVKQSLKTIYGRLHGKSMIDLPFNPDTVLSAREMNVATLYCFNDLEATKTLCKALREPIELRIALARTYPSIDFRSRSDAQIGERVIRKRVDIASGGRVEKKIGGNFGLTTMKPGDTFTYKAPAFLRFENPELIQLLADVQKKDIFKIGEQHKVVTPTVLLKRKITIKRTTYALGIGGLHSTEESRAIVTDEDHELEDVDVSSQYPYAILALGLFPRGIGPRFISEYRAMVEERVAAKKAGRKTEADGGKIAVNGISGKLSSEFSPLYAPNITAAMTLTCQLSSLMLIDRADQIGVETVSANTDGVLFYFQKEKRLELDAVIKQWETDTGFEIERTPYKAIYSSSVNTYMAIKPDGKAKRKGPIANPWYDGDLRGMMMKNPQMEICSDAVLKLITEGKSIEETIREAKDPRDFVTIINVKGGGTWRNEYIGKVVRFYWSTDSAPIYATSAASTKTGKRKVANTDGSRPLMVLPDELPDDVDYQHYIDKAKEIAHDIGALERDDDDMVKRRAS